MRLHRPRAILCAAILLAAFGTECFAQRVLVSTQALTTMRESVRVYVQSAQFADAGIPGVLPGPVPLPQSIAVGEPLLTSDTQTALFVSEPNDGIFYPALQEDAAHVTAFQSAPFRPLLPMDLHTSHGWRIRAAKLLVHPVNGGDTLVLAKEGPGPRSGQAGRLAAHPIGVEGDASSLDSRSWPLPGAPMALGLIPNLGRAVVLCAPTQSAGPQIHIRDILTGQAIAESSPLYEQRGPAREIMAADIAAEAGAGYVYVLISGRALEEGQAEPVSWLYAIGSNTGEPVRNPAELPGQTSTTRSALHPVGDGACWIVTYSEDSGFGWVNRVQITAQGIHVQAQHPISGASQAPLAAMSPDGNTLATAAGSRLDMWEEGGSTAASRKFENLLGALKWTEQGLFAGEANRLHLLDPQTLAPLESLDFQSGHVHAVTPLPAESLPAPDPDGDGIPTPKEVQWGLDPENPDTDGDGIHDGRDPLPRTPSNQLQTPAFINFSGEAVGHEIRAIHFPHGGDPDNGFRWNVQFEAAEMPWLVAEPRSGMSGGALYLGVDRAWYGAFESVQEGTLTIRATENAPHAELAGSPATVRIRVIPHKEQARKILWLTAQNLGDPAFQAADSAHSLGRLSRLLAEAPRHFSHAAMQVAPSAASLAEYKAVVLDVQKALEGVVLRHDLLEYVRNGGALLFLGGHLPGGEPIMLNRWLSPAGINLQVQTPISDSFSRAAPNPLTDSWSGFDIANGCAIRINPPAEALVPGASTETDAVFATARHGHGRIAVLAAPTPLENPAMQDPTNRQFAAGLFEWLARAGIETADLDGDGLPDTIEDRDQDGVRDPWETSPISPDTDHDGIPDGLEDMNRNGQLDDGETSPVNPDTDGDGILDGADPAPLPQFGTPVIESVEPNAGPAQGGTEVVITGRNFAPNSIVWFGKHPAASVRALGPQNLIAVTPPISHGSGDVSPADVRVLNPSVGLEGTLPNAFDYTATSVARVTLESIRAAQTRYGGMISIRLDNPSQVPIGRMALRLEATGGPEVNWGQVRTGAGSEFAGRDVFAGAAPDNHLWINATKAEAGRASVAGELARVPYSTETPVSSAITFSIPWAQILAPNGQPLRMETKPLAIPP